MINRDKVEGMVNTLLAMQMKFNNDTNGEIWTKGMTKDGRRIDWNICMMTEATEAVDSYNWKHWKDKGGVDDLENLKMELTDIFHFLMSECIIRDATHFITPYVIENMECDEDMSYKRDTMLGKLKLFIMLILKNDASEVTNTMFLRRAIDIFFDMVEGLEGFSFIELYKLYMGKNVLNVFRQQSGYNSGDKEYVKVFGGKEDNVWLMDYLEVADDTSFDGIMCYLTAVYEENTK